MVQIITHIITGRRWSNKIVFMWRNFIFGDIGDLGMTSYVILELQQYEL